MKLEKVTITAVSRRIYAILRADSKPLRQYLHEHLVYLHSSTFVKDREVYIKELQVWSLTGSAKLACLAFSCCCR